MSFHLPRPIEFFMFSENTHDPDAVADCFAPDSTVRDEGRTRTGVTEIAAWRRETAAKYHHTVTPITIAKRAGKTVVTTKMAGEFPGSPITVEFVFRLAGGKIASLEIVP